MFNVRTMTGGLLAFCAVLVLSVAGCSSYRGAWLYQSGTLALDRGDSARAVEDLEHAAQFVPEASEVQNHLGLAYAATGRDADALKAFQRAVDIDCGNRAAVENLAAAQRHHSGGTAP
jgi:Flp pilus assembly protein TadD